ncbi:Hypothetical predicted protein [Pelobates cultripes]|uniref:Uncharacterized protein n=1 Tax=Pelobates cultripes TaxID=61616 RepID=A0AAD1TEA1_PELCU|nr:Hypothetical predicted protein [Pelobates cultripes]
MVVTTEEPTAESFMAEFLAQIDLIFECFWANLEAQEHYQQLFEPITTESLTQHSSAHLIAPRSEPPCSQPDQQNISSTQQSTSTYLPETSCQEPSSPPINW